MKVLINVSVPAVDSQYDIWVPDDVSVGSITPLIADAVYELSEHKYKRSGNEFLCLKNPEQLLRSDVLLQNYSIKNGTRLVLL